MKPNQIVDMPSLASKKWMKQLFYILLTCLSISSLTGQTNINLFIAPNGGAGLRSQPAEIYWNKGIGWSTDLRYLKESTDTIIRTPFQYRWGIDFGLTWRNQLFLFTGIARTTRYDHGVLSCSVCGLESSGRPVPLQHEFWEIPIGINYLFNAQKRISPFVGATVFYTESTKENMYQSWAFQWRLGTSFRISKSMFLQMAFYTQGNRRSQEKPHYIFREAGAQLSLVKIFRKTE